jgi:iron complex outermembrane recepter protein
MSDIGRETLSVRTKQLVWLTSAATIALLALPAAAQAQDQNPADNDATTNGDPEIIVMARKQAETLQEVPLTVTAISNQTLENYGVNQVADVVSRVPTLSVQVGGSGSGGSIALRGVGSSAISASFDSAVAFDFDGVVISTMRLVQAGFFDVKQIDVLKGPQSLFFGKSASAGVFSLHSADPTQSWEVGGKASYEFEERGYVLGGYISGPLSETLGVRLAAQYNDVKRYNQIQSGIPTVNPNRGNTDFVSRLTLAWEPSDRFKANLKLNYVTNRNDGAIAFQDVNCGANGRADEVVLLGGAIAIPSGADCNNKDKFFAVSDPSATQTTKFPDGSAGVGRYPGHAFGRTNIFFGRLNWDLELNDYLKLSSVSGILKLDAIDFDSYSSVGVGPARNPNGVPVAAIAPLLAAVNTVGSAQGFGSSDPRNKTDQYSQEIRLASDLSGNFNFMLGAFYEYRDIDFNTSQQGVNISIIALDPITGNSYDWYKKHKTKTDAYSVFGSATLDLTDKLELAGGLRWTKERKVNTISVPYVHLFLSSGPAFIDSGFFSGPIVFKDTNLSPEVSLRYKISNDVNLYAAYKTGYKSGGIDNSALPSSNLLGFSDPDPAVRAAVANGLIYKSETAKGGEVGAKMQFADRSITLNASAFYYVFTNLQLQNFNATTIQFVTFNASELTSKGLDFDFAWRTPVEGLNFSGSLAVTNAKFTKPLISAITGEDLNGRRASRAPSLAGNIAFDWSTPITEGVALGLNGNMQYSGSYFTANTSNKVLGQQPVVGDLKQKSFATFDGSISIGDPDHRWKLALVGVNLTNKIYALTSGGRPFLTGVPLGTPGSANFVPVGDDLNVNYNRGRQVFVEASFRF